MKNFNQIIAGLNDKHVFIQTHNFPDPDAIASAYGLQELLKARGIQSTICYKGHVDHGSAVAMAQKLDIKIVEYAQVKDMAESAEIILVDAQKGNANIIDMPGNEVMCIDHHPTFEKIDYVFEDIRPEVGACASIIAEYFFNNDITMSREVATALLYGIKVDTANLTRGVSDLDLDMFYRMYNMADHYLITSMDNSALRLEDLRAYEIAINSIETYDRVSFASVGYNCQEALIASISDFIMMLDTTDTTVVYSLKEGGIKLSIRTMEELNVGKITNDALEGIGNGGGHENMAGGFVPYDESVSSPVNNKEYIDELVADIKKRFLETINSCKKL
ncbi:MAG: DHH family phosphoesterase [Lachnospira sp.]|nr:DHH family phosphoesterase [Lachnospira sp.]